MCACLVCVVVSRFPMALHCPHPEQGLRDGEGDGSMSFTLALGRPGLRVPPEHIPAATPAPRGLCLNCECCVNTAGRELVHRALPANALLWQSRRSELPRGQQSAPPAQLGLGAGFGTIGARLC